MCVVCVCMLIATNCPLLFPAPPLPQVASECPQEPPPCAPASQSQSSEAELLRQSGLRLHQCKVGREGGGEGRGEGGGGEERVEGGRGGGGGREEEVFTQK